MVLPLLQLPSLIGYHIEGQCLGSCLAWEWRHFHYSLHTEPLARWWRKNGKSIVDGIVVSMSFTPAEYAKADVQDTSARVELTTGTKLVASMLLHTACARTLSRPRKELAYKLSRRWLELSSLGMGTLQPHTELGCAVDMGPNFDQLKLMLELPSHTIAGMDALVVPFPRLHDLWAHFGQRCQRLQSSLARPLLVELIMFLWFLGTYVMWRSKTWLAPLTTQLLSIASFCIGKYVLDIYLPTHGRLKRADALRAATRRRRLDPIAKERIHLKLDTVQGGDRQTAIAADGYAWQANEKRHNTLVLYNKEAQRQFRDAEVLSIAADPGAYGGEDTNVGAAFNNATHIAAVLPCKAIRVF